MLHMYFLAMKYTGKQIQRELLYLVISPLTIETLEQGVKYVQS